ncbi:MAG: hypothetical protein PWP23_3032, partial [Candidatus Sumerlaeota bacterium]|nr:hypothetical protein [Candidatus Sumerlaeota bacterium]
PAKTDPRFAEFVVGTDEAAKAAVRSGVLTPRYVDSHFASVDNVILQRASGINNPPRILTKPLANAKAGTVHTQQLVAVDPDTGTATGITFSPVSVPGGFGISSAGLITWDTSTVLTGDYDITIAAADAAGATTHLSWILSVVDVIMPPPFGIASVPDGDVLIGNEWTYAPSLTGTASGIPIAWSLVDGPQGMTIDPQTGAMAWDSTGVTLSAKGNASFRVIIRAEETGGLGRTAIQEFNVDVENRFDSIDIKLQGNRDQWMLF